MKIGEGMLLYSAMPKLLYSAMPKLLYSAMPKLWNGSKEDSNSGSQLSIDSPAVYRLDTTLRTNVNIDSCLINNNEIIYKTPCNKTCSKALYIGKCYSGVINIVRSPLSAIMDNCLNRQQITFWEVFIDHWDISAEIRILVIILWHCCFWPSTCVMCF